MAQGVKHTLKPAPLFSSTILFTFFGLPLKNNIFKAVAIDTQPQQILCQSLIIDDITTQPVLRLVEKTSQPQNQQEVIQTLFEIKLRDVNDHSPASFTDFIDSIKIFDQICHFNTVKMDQFLDLVTSCVKSIYTKNKTFSFTEKLPVLNHRILIPPRGFEKDRLEKFKQKLWQQTKNDIHKQTKTT